MHSEVEAFVKWASPTHEEDEMRALVVSQITKAVTSAYHDAQVHPFGSFATKLFLPLGYDRPRFELIQRTEFVSEI